MMQATTEMAVHRTVTVQAPPERAFAVFTERFDSWWPRSHHIAEADMEEAVIEPRAGGTWYERGVDGSRTVWGQVLAYEPPRRLVLEWRIGGKWGFEPDPAAVSEVEVTFTPAGDAATRVDLTHRHLERHSHAAELAAAVDDERGWPGLLELYSAAVSAG